jgi:drug/metabolite transporter (DMT)-like permease
LPQTPPSSSPRTPPQSFSPAALRTYSVLLLFIALKAAGNLSLAWGMKHLEGHASTNPLYYVRAIFDPFVGVGIVMLIVALLARMVLLSLADLSFVLPVTAVGYVLAALLGKLVLHEVVTQQRWLGTILIFAGAALVSSTSQKTSTQKADTGESPAGEPSK